MGICCAKKWWIFNSLHNFLRLYSDILENIFFFVVIYKLHFGNITGKILRFFYCCNFCCILPFTDALSTSLESVASSKRSFVSYPPAAIP